MIWIAILAVLTSSCIVDAKFVKSITVDLPPLVFPSETNVSYSSSVPIRHGAICTMRIARDTSAADALGRDLWDGYSKGSVVASWPHNSDRSSVRVTLPKNPYNSGWQISESASTFSYFLIIACPSKEAPTDVLINDEGWNIASVKPDVSNADYNDKEDSCSNFREDSVCTTWATSAAYNFVRQVCVWHWGWSKCMTKEQYARSSAGYNNNGESGLGDDDSPWLTKQEEEAEQLAENQRQERQTQLRNQWRAEAAADSMTLVDGSESGSITGVALIVVIVLSVLLVLTCGALLLVSLSKVRSGSTFAMPAVSGSRVQARDTRIYQKSHRMSSQSHRYYRSGRY